MKNVLDFLNNAETYYLATSENDIPHVRPIGLENPKAFRETTTGERQALVI